MTASDLRRLGPLATADDYRRCMVGGLDRYSRLDLARLRLLVGREIDCEFSPDRKELAKVYRWMLRGLPQYMAIRKVSVDRERDEEVRAAANWESLYREFLTYAF